jgi:hypothetical protein
MDLETPDHVEIRSVFPRPRWWLGLVVVAVCAAGLVAAVQVGGVGASAAVTSDPNAPIREAVAGGLNAMLRGTVAGATGARAADVTSGQLEQQSRALPQTLGAHFTGDLLARYTTTLQAALTDQEASGLRDVDGGVTQVLFTSLNVNGAEASGTARGLAWLKGDAVSGGNQTAPQGWWDYAFHLVETGSGWRIDQLSFVPEPGSAP